MVGGGGRWLTCNSRRMRHWANEVRHCRVDSSRTASKVKESIAMRRLRRRIRERMMKKR